MSKYDSFAAEFTISSSIGKIDMEGRAKDENADCIKTFKILRSLKI